MVSFRKSTDNYSMDVLKDSMHIGMIQWHPNREPRLTRGSDFYNLPLSELKQITEKLEECANGSIRQRTG